VRNRLASLALVAFAAFVVGAQVAPASAASSGLAYDSVTKFAPGGDTSSFAPGAFQSDFQAASQVQAPSEGHGMFSGIGKAVAGAESAMRMLKTGTAERHYVAGAKERTDSLAAQSATILDCSARTLTTLDLAKKTYRVVSLDATSQPGAPGARGNPGPTPTDDGSKVAVALTNRSLGPKNVDGTPTNGYDSNVQMTVTKPGGEPHSFDMDMVAYYSGYAQPAPTCPRSPYATPGAAQSAAMLASYGLLQRALRTPGGDPRFSVTTNGPSAPRGKLSLFDLVTMKQQAQDRAGFTIVSERGNVRSVSETDPVFSVPPGYALLP
jgi:hypothetical protein